MDFLISPAHAQGAAQSDPFGFFLPMIVIFVAFYFLLIRPQQKRQKGP
jgi:preprotein translocase subunit YajC